MIDVTTQEVLPLSKARNFIKGKRPSIATIHRWALQGIRAADGRTVRLETVQLGGARVTSAEAIQEFVDALTEARTPPAPGPRDARPLTLTKKRRVEQAERELDAAGL